MNRLILDIIIVIIEAHFTSVVVCIPQDGWWWAVNYRKHHAQINCAVNANVNVNVNVPTPIAVDSLGCPLPRGKWQWN